jgi:hypothetical protein
VNEALRKTSGSDDPHRQRAARYDFAGERSALAYSRGTHQEGIQLRRFYELKLDRSEHPMFILSWMLFHVIESPLYGATSADLAKDDALLVLNVGGLDDSSAQATVCRHVYSWRDIR